MVFVLGVLTLLALVGLVLIARTTGESRRIVLDQAALAEKSAMNGVVRAIQETLRRDIWGPNPNLNAPMPLDDNGQGLAGFLENNEPFDAPGPDDRWLASTTPYFAGDGISTGNNLAPPAPPPENGVLAWHHVSYLGNDVIQVDPLQPFAWAVNSRVEPATPIGSYAVDNLQNVLILQTPPAALGGIPLVPGSTTNLTIASARAAWYDPAHLAALAAALPGTSPRFPYFDTNADGALDLYDADGDGIPDSPISLVLPTDSADPNGPSQLYAAVRIVDHASMLNVNVASSATMPAGGMMFDELLPGLQRRGQRLTELYVDPVLQAVDRDYSDPAGTRAAGMVAYRYKDSLPYPVRYDSDVVRRALAGGDAGGLDYFLYGLGDEASLRNRGMLVPRTRRFEAGLTGFETIDRALPGTTLWTRTVDPANGYGYAGSAGRWSRLNANWVSPDYEGYNDTFDPNIKGWRTLLVEDQPYAIHRHLLTTVSHEVVPSPEGLPLDSAGDALAIGELSVNPVRFQTNPALDAYMEWPILGRTANPDVPEWMRVQRVDLNMSVAPPNTALDIQNTKEQFILYAAGAMYRALAGVTVYQKQNVTASNREWLAWQFALNLADYRDSDNDPTIVEWPTGSGHYLFGLEKQPFFTEAYAYLTAGDPTIPVPDRWFFAVELYIPPYWDLSGSAGDLFIRAPGSTNGANLLSLNSFTQVTNGLAPVLTDGGSGTGKYVVLCGDISYKPSTLNAQLFYRHQTPIPFDLDITSGSGRVELVWSPDGNPANPLNHVLDAIDPEFSGGTLTNGGQLAAGNWATNSGGTAIVQPARKEFSLIRSTQGWRFTTGWHSYATRQVPSLISQPPLPQSLGAANNTAATLDDQIPESIWPARVALNGNMPVDSFGSGKPYEAFDSVGEIGRMLMIGPVNQPPAVPPYQELSDWTTAAYDLPATAMLGAILDKNAVPDFMDGTRHRLAAGRPDMVSADRNDETPWAWRLLDYFTTQSPLFDAVDNDGDGAIDAYGRPLAPDPSPDATEGVEVLNRVAGRININTAPLSVLRAVPHLSFLPDSAEFILRAGGSGNSAADFDAAPHAYWDFASAMVARREDREVPLRLWDAGLQTMRTVAIAKRRDPAADPFSGRPRPGDPMEGVGAFKTLGQLANMVNVEDASGAGNAALFRTDRFTVTPSNPALALFSHKVIAGDPDVGDPSTGVMDPFSPDYRYRRVDNDDDGSFDLAQNDDFVADYVPVLPPGQIEGAGIRARDIFLARLANMLTVRSDVFTAYIVLLDEHGRYVQRSQFTLDRSECFRERLGVGTTGSAVLPRILTRSGGAYAEDMR